MKRIYEFITKANQVLLFIALLAVISGVAFLVYQSSLSHYQPPQVPVAQTPGEAKKAVVEDVQFLGEVSDIYVFGIIQRGVTGPADSKVFGVAAMSLSSATEERGQIVNVVFSKQQKRIRTLLARSGLVLDTRIHGQPDYLQKLKSHVFLCVTEDTDGNHILDKKDRNDLYIISASLDAPDVVIADVSSYEIVQPNRIMIKTGQPSAPHFWEVDAETHAMKEIIW